MDKTTYKLLCYINKNTLPSLMSKAFLDKFGGLEAVALMLDYLKENKYLISITDPEGKRYEVSQRGKAFIAKEKSDKFNSIITKIIAILTLLISAALLAIKINEMLKLKIVTSII